MPSELITAVPNCALAVFAHPDDSDVSCGATLARWHDEGCETVVVICALGDKGSHHPGTDPDLLIERRADEVEAARRVLGIDRLYRLEHRDGEFENDLRLRGELVEIIRTVRPEALLCPDPTAVFFGEHYYNHRDHRITGAAALDAASPAAGLPLYFPECGEPWSIETAYLAGSLEPNVVIDVSSSIERKVQAVCCHESQLAGGGEAIREALLEGATEAGKVHRLGAAEAFRRIVLSP